MLVYVIRNKVNGKCYVGQTVRSLEERWKAHCQDNRQRLTRMPIAAAIHKHGKENFEIEVLEECHSQVELNIAEVRWALELKAFWPTGYNLKAGGARGTTSKELRRRISEGSKGKKASEETRLKLSKSHLGHRHSAETLRKMSNYWKGRPRLNRRGRTTAYKNYELVSPTGEKLLVKNMREFCLEQQLSRFKMSEVVNGKRPSHKGWRVKRSPVD